MEEIKFYKLLKGVEMHWEKTELLVWLPFSKLEKFMNLVGADFYCESGGIDVKLQGDCVCFDIVEVCEYFGIDPTDICEKED